MPFRQSISSSYKVIMFSCDQCQYRVESSSLLNIHKNSSHQLRKYNCTICGLQFSRKGNLSQHQKAVHEGVKYPCRQCDHQATSKGNLAQHTRAVHEGTSWAELGLTQAETVSLELKLKLSLFDLTDPTPHSDRVNKTNSSYLS